MFRWLRRSNHAFDIIENAWVGVHFVRNKSTGDLRKALAKAFGYIHQRTRTDMEKKMKELTDLFSKTSKELAEMVKQNQEFILEEIRKAEETVREASQECSSKHSGRLRDVRDRYMDRIKICNEMAAAGVRDVKARCEEQMGTTEGLQDSMKRILKECLETDELVKCLASRTKQSASQRKLIVERLTETVRNAEVSIAQQLKDTAKCYADAKTESLKNLAVILKDIKDCLAEKK